MSNPFKKATRDSTPLLIGMAGGTGSGKTFSALRLARGLVGEQGRVAVIDTERGRAKHYAGDFDFDHALLEPPFTPERYMETVEIAEREGYDCIVVDSMSHEWEGPGGLLETANEIAAKMASKWNKSPDAYTFPSWREPKQRHQKLVNRLLQLQCHAIFCFRAKEKLKLVKQGGRQEIVSQGLQPIMEDGLPYEMTLFMVMHADRPGVPHFTHKALARPFHGMFPEGREIAESHGRALAEWSSGSPQQAPATPPYDMAEAAELEAAADLDGLKRWGNKHRAAMTNEDKAKIRNAIKRLQDAADPALDPAEGPHEEAEA